MCQQTVTRTKKQGYNNAGAMQVLKICWGCQINLLPTKVREKT